MSLVIIYVDGVKWGLITTNGYHSKEFRERIRIYNQGQWKKLFLGVVGRLVSKDKR